MTVRKQPSHFQVILGYRKLEIKSEVIPPGLEVFAYWGLSLPLVPHLLPLSSLLNVNLFCFSHIPSLVPPEQLCCTSLALKQATLSPRRYLEMFRDVWRLSGYRDLRNAASIQWVEASYTAKHNPTMHRIILHNKELSVLKCQ